MSIDKEEIDRLCNIVGDDSVDRTARLTALAELAAMPVEARAHMHPAFQLFLPASGSSVSAKQPDVKLAAVCSMHAPGDPGAMVAGD